MEPLGQDPGGLATFAAALGAEGFSQPAAGSVSAESFGVTLTPQGDFGGGALMADAGVATEIIGFAQKLNLEHEALSFMYGVPSHLRQTIMNNFDPTGTKDGNVLGRLQGYVKVMMRKNGIEMHDLHTPQPRQPVRREPQLVSVHPGDLPEAIAAWVQSLGLGENAAGFLAGLPADMQQSILQNFDATGTKDGNVWGRLLGYVRSLWSRKLSLPPEATATVRALPDELQVKVILSFDAAGSKDGNVTARLMGFCNHLAVRHGLIAGAQPVVSAAPMAPVSLAPISAAPALRSYPASHTAYAQALNVSTVAVQATDAGVSATTGGISMAQFCSNMGLDTNASNFLQHLPVEVQSAIITTFDPSGTKDGNIWGRLFAFARRLWAQHVGLDRGTIDQIKACSEEEQIRTIVDWTMKQGGGVSYALQPQPQPQPVLQTLPPAQHTYQPATHFGLQHQPNAVAAEALPLGASRWDQVQVTDPTLVDFVRLWGLDGRATGFLQSLPEHVRQQVMRSFDGSASKDGNVWGRLFGYIRQTWANSLGLDQEAMRFVKELPEEAQMICLTDFDPSGTKDGNVVGRLQGFARKALKQSGFQAPPPTAASVAGSFGAPAGGHGVFAHPAPLTAAPVAAAIPTQVSGAVMRGEVDIQGFIERCGLDHNSYAWLASLPEDIVTTVVTEFDPTGTKDGNVLGRLQGYVRLLNARAQRKRMSEDPTGALSSKRPRYGGVY